MVISAHIDQWDVTKILIDNGCQCGNTLSINLWKMGYNTKQLKEPTLPLYGFGGKRIKPVGVITLPIYFGTPKNPRIEYITFDMIDMLYPYNATFRQGLLNTIEATLHSTYLCLKVPTNFNAITLCGSQNNARSMEPCFALGHKMYIFLRKA
jgi:hypothetical protein